MTTAEQAAPTPVELRALVKPLTFIALVLALPFGMGSNWAIFRDADTSWQVAAGQWILQHGRIPTSDPFSFTVFGHPWVAMEWLAEIIFALAYRLAGFSGLATLIAAALITTHAIIFYHLEKRVSVTLIAATLIAMDFVIAQFILARPHVLAWPLVAGWTVLLLSSSEKGGPPPLWSALVLVLWSNLHASWPIGLLITGAIGLDSLIAARWDNLREWALFAVASLLAVCLNANGISGLLQPFQTSNLAMLPLIGEWHRSTPLESPFFFALLVIAAGALLLTKKRLPIGRALLLLVLLALAIAHMRHQSLFAIVAACVLPPLWRADCVQQPVPRWLLLCVVPMLAFRAVSAVPLPEMQANPAHLISGIPPELKTQPLFNGYMFGGPLILAGVRPYIDGRAEIYGDQFVLDYVAITNGDMRRFNRAIDRYGISWAMIPVGDKKLIKEIEATGEWRRLYSDTVGVVDVRAVRTISRHRGSGGSARAA